MNTDYIDILGEIYIDSKSQDNDTQERARIIIQILAEIYL